MDYAKGSKTLLKVIQDLSAVRSIESITQLVRTAAREIAEADGATFVLRDDNMCSYVDEDALEPLWKGQKFPLQACVSGWSMLHREQLVIPDIYKDERVPIDAYRPTFVKSMAMTPIRKEDPIGAIGTYWKTPHVPSPEQLQFLQALADSVSVAIENVHLYNNLEQNIVELKKANLAKDVFLMNVSHELRTPLNAILGWSEIIGDETSPAEVKMGLETIQRNAQNQLKIVEDLLDTSRIVAGRMHFDKAPVDIVQVVEHSLIAFKAELQKKKLTVDFKSSFQTAVVQGDAVRLRQVMDNLVMNAIKFSNPGGRIWVALDKKGPQVEFSIKDDGAGIEAQFIPRMFERLQQADNSRTRKYGGLGLGLSISKHLVEAFGGEISGESAGVNQGATFRVRFPLHDFVMKTALETATEAPSKESLKGTRILIVDDDQDCRRVLERILKNYGAEVVSADSVRQALTKDPNYEVIVCDLSMPEEDGFSLAHRIREGRTQFEKEIPLMALTAFTDGAHEKKALEEGFDRFMGKPFNVPSLITNVKELRNSMH